MLRPPVWSGVGSAGLTRQTLHRPVPEQSVRVRIIARCFETETRGRQESPRIGQVEMSSEKTTAIVIRQTDFSETSRVVTLFTRDFGRISALAKGARRLKGPFDSALDLLTTCQIVFLRKSSGSLDLLTEAKLLSRFRPQGNNLTSLYGGYYVAELLTGLTEEYDPHPTLYDSACQTLREVESSDQPLDGIARFEIEILREIGQLPEFDRCVVCHETVRNQTTYSFWLSQSGLICRSCQKGNFDSFQIQPGTLAVLRKLSTSDDALSSRVILTEQQIKEIRRLLSGMINESLGRRPKMARYLTANS